MPYIKKLYIFRDSIEVEKVFSGRYGKHTPHGKKKKPTPEEVKDINRRNAIKKLRRKIKANFEPVRDYHMVLTYKKTNRPDPEQAKKNLDKFISNMRRAYRKSGSELKYIIATEYENKAIHHHLIINGIQDTIKLVSKYWPYGHSNFTPLWEEESMGELAEYLIKETDKTFRSGKYQRQRYRCSRNLVEPVCKVEVVKANTFRKEPKPVKGYYIDKNSIVTGTTKEFGYPYQYYTMIKIEKKRE